MGDDPFRRQRSVVCAGNVHASENETIGAICQWMNDNFLKLNGDMLIGSARQFSKFSAQKIMLAILL